MPLGQKPALTSCVWDIILALAGLIITIPTYVWLVDVDDKTGEQLGGKTTASELRPYDPSGSDK